MRSVFAISMLLFIAMSVSAQESRPNFIVIYTDDQQRDAYGAYGNDQIRTPHLDTLAEQSIRFTEAHTVLSLCSPARAALLTGRYNSANGVDRLHARLNEGERSFANYFKEAGYQTAVCGKWHLPNKPESLGFDFSCTFYANGSYYNRKVNDNGIIKRPAEHIDSYCAKRSVDYLQEAVKKDRPFVLFHNTQTPHMDGRRIWNATNKTLAAYNTDDMPLPETWDDDLTGKPPYLTNVRNRIVAQTEYGYGDPEKIQQHAKACYAVVTEMDNALGIVFDEIDRLELSENTYIIFMSDNGWLLGDHGMTSKVLCYQPSTRVPLTIAGPGIKSGQTTDRIALNIDIAPTLLQLAGLDIPDNMHGRSLAPLLHGEETDWRDHFIYECLGGYGGSKPMLAAISHDYKLLYTYDDDQSDTPSFVEFYDLKKDPGELINLANAPKLQSDPAVRAAHKKLRQLVADHRVSRLK